jgi:hypothetical protein
MRRRAVALLLGLLLSLLTAACGGSDKSEGSNSSASSPKAGTSTGDVGEANGNEKSKEPDETYDSDLMATRPGTIKLRENNEDSGPYDVLCAGDDKGVYLATRNIDLNARKDGDYTNNLVPDDGGDFAYLILHDDQPITNRYIDFGQVPWDPDLPSLAYQALLDGRATGGSWDQATDVEVTTHGPDALKGELYIEEPPHLTLLVSWNCR